MWIDSCSASGMVFGNLGKLSGEGNGQYISFGVKECWNYTQGEKILSWEYIIKEKNFIIEKKKIVISYASRLALK